MLSTKSIVRKGAAEIPTVEAAHSGFGPSSAKRWMNCPGSVLLTENMPDKDSPFAMEGTAAHTLSEWCRRQNKQARDFKGQEVPVPMVDGGIRRILVDQEMVDGVQAFIDYVNTFDSDVEIIEEKVSYEAWVKDGWGTLDDGRISIKHKMCYITDLKYGKGIMEFATDNYQLKLYALGIFQDYGHLYDIDNFQLNIFQPRLDHIDQWGISTIDLLKWAEAEVRVAAVLAHKPGAPLKAGDWCQFCRAKATCPTRAKWVQDIAVNDFDDLDGPSTLRQVALMTNDEIAAKLLPNLDHIKAWCVDVHAYAMSQVQKGNAVGEYKLVEGRSKRMYRDESEAAKALGNLREVTIDQYMPRKLLTAPRIEKLLGKKHKFMTEHVVKPPGKPVLVPGSDPRPTLKIDPNAEFADLGTETGEDE